MAYGVLAVIEDASAFITITLLFNFSRFFLNSKTTYFGAFENKEKTTYRPIYQEVIFYEHFGSTCCLYFFGSLRGALC